MAIWLGHSGHTPYDDFASTFRGIISIECPIHQLTSPGYAPSIWLGPKPCLANSWIDQAMLMVQPKFLWTEHLRLYTNEGSAALLMQVVGIGADGQLTLQMGFLKISATPTEVQPRKR